MKSPRVGERVRIYDGRRVVEGVIVEVQGNYLNVKIPAAVVLVVHENIWFVDRRQCVRLVKKKRREWYLHPSPSLDAGLERTVSGTPTTTVLGVPYIHVREVGKK